MSTNESSYSIDSASIRSGRRITAHIAWRHRFYRRTAPRPVLTSSIDIEEFHSSLRIQQASLGYQWSQVACSQGMAN